MFTSTATCSLNHPLQDSQMISFTFQTSCDVSHSKGDYKTLDEVTLKVPMVSNLTFSGIERLTRCYKAFKPPEYVKTCIQKVTRHRLLTAGLATASLTHLNKRV